MFLEALFVSDEIDVSPCLPYRHLRLPRTDGLATVVSDHPPSNHDRGSPADDLPAVPGFARHARVVRVLPLRPVQNGAQSSPPLRFETGITQAYQWTLLSQYIKSCPTNNPRIEFTRFPLLDVTNQPYALDGTPGLNSNYTLTEGADRRVDLYWEPLNKTVGPDGLYVTESVAGEPKFLAFIDQLNVTYAPLQGVNLTSRVAHAIVPNGTVFPPEPVVVNTAFVAVVDEDVFLTPYNISLINK